jgi:hypothetical protein
MATVGMCFRRRNGACAKDLHPVPDYHYRKLRHPFARLFGTSFAVLLFVLAATAQAGGGKAVTPPIAGSVAGFVT